MLGIVEDYVTGLRCNNRHQHDTYSRQHAPCEGRAICRLLHVIAPSRGPLRRKGAHCKSPPTTLTPLFECRGVYQDCTRYSCAGAAGRNDARVGVVTTQSRTAPPYAAFDQRLRELVEGQNLIVDFLNPEQQPGGNADAVQELIRRKVQVIVVVEGSPLGHHNGAARNGRDRLRSARTWLPANVFTA